MKANFRPDGQGCQSKVDICVREKRIWLAAGSAVLAKGGGLALQVAAFPIVVRALGVERFAIFSLVSAILGFMAFAQFGIGGYLTQQISARIAMRDKTGIGQITWTAVLTIACLAFVVGSSLALVAHVRGLEWLWGSAYRDNAEVLSWGFHYVLIAAFLTLFFNTFAGCQAGYQELHIGNLYSGFGNLLAAIGLIVVGLYGGAGERQFWLVLYGVPLVVLIVNSCHLIRRHPELAYHGSLLRPNLVPTLLTSGAGFMVVQTLVPLCQREGARLTLAHHGTLIEVGHLSVFLQLTIILSGLIIIFTQPLYGAIADAYARGDDLWTRLRLKQMRMYFAVLFVLICVGAYGAGPSLLRLWLGEAMAVGRTECLFFALYFSVTMYVHVNYVFLLGQRQMRSSVIAALVEVVILVAVFVCVSPKTTGVLLLWVGGVQLFTSLPITSLALRRMRLRSAKVM